MTQSEEATDKPRRNHLRQYHDNGWVHGTHEEPNKGDGECILYEVRDEPNGQLETNADDSVEIDHSCRSNLNN